MGFFTKIFTRQKKRYDEQKQKLASGTAADRAELAKDSGTNPEILYYLARDENADIRRAVAVNKATPVQASTLLARDKDVDVRLALAARLVELLPDLSPEKHSQLYAYTVQALGMLAQDEVLKIRKALSSALKDHAHAPPKVTGQLARDVEREVSEPILRFCVALADDDLLDILSSHPEPWVIAAVASRPAVSMPVADAVVETRDVPGNTVLLGNDGAALSAETLQTIIARAREYPEWHAPIAARKELSVDLAAQLAGFVNESVLNILEKRPDFDAATRRDVAALVQRRMEYSSGSAPQEAPEAKLERYVASGKLGPEVIQDALVWKDMPFVIMALAYMSRIHPVVVDKMLRSGAARPIIALTHRAGLPMRLAIALQRDAGKLQPKDMIYARGGTDYPLTAEEIKWQLEFFGVEG
jgi:uncharacterized protein (DUF2336 family)